jgi:hypothetical protein
MKPIDQTAIMRLSICSILLILLTTCNSGVPEETTTPTLPAPPTQDRTGLSPEANATLRSLEKLHDYPFYVMYYYGEYYYPRIGSTLPEATDFSCSLFAALGEAGDMFYGRNFDWEFIPGDQSCCFEDANRPAPGGANCTAHRSLHAF